MERIPEILSKLTAPEDFSRENLSKHGYESLSLSELERIRLKKIIEVLEHKELAVMVMEEKLTLAMIKPRSDWNTKDLSDLEAAKEIEKEIGKPLEVVFSISINFSKEDVEHFYKEPKVNLVELPTIRRTDFKNRWDEFVDIMLSGPTTFLLLHSEDGNAVSEWRRQIGHFDVEKKRDEGTIRGRWAKDNYTSIVHGSDEPEAVCEEITLLKDHLRRISELRQQDIIYKQASGFEI